VTRWRRDSPEPGPSMPEGRTELRPPPPLPDRSETGGALGGAIPMLGSLGSVVVIATMAGSSPGGQQRGLLTAGVLLAVTVAFVGCQFDRDRQRRTRAVIRSRTDYLAYLDTVRATVRDAATRQRAALLWAHPAPSSLPALAAERSRVWRRSDDDPRFLQVRYGVSDRPLSWELVPPDPASMEGGDPALVSALARLLAVHRLQPDLPVALDLREYERIDLCGPQEATRGLARAMICSAATFQSPEHVVVAVLASAESLPDWEWVKWLPHALSPGRADSAGPRRMVAICPADLEPLLPGSAAEPAAGHASQAHVLLVLDRVEQPPEDVTLAVGQHGVTVLNLTGGPGAPEDASRLRMVLDDGPGDVRERTSLSVQQGLADPVQAWADRCDPATAEAVARRLAPLEVAADASGSGQETGQGEFTDLLGVGDVRRYEPAAAWQPRPARLRLRVPIGTGPDGGAVHLDLKESALHGMGPHGLVVGATGSGKSELLRTLVLGLAITHSPDQLSMVLVDFKGGATFAGMSAMPHVSALITNLAQELTLVDRMQDALSGELVRRQELLRRAGNYASVTDYERARASGRDLAPLPSLLIVVDEFSEMLSAKPEFIDLFVAIGRLGRSLGLHLLLASQRLEEGRLRGLESHLSYRIGLRTFSAQESRAVLGVPDAYELPPVPGLGFLQAGRSALVPFTAAYVSGLPARRATPVARDDTAGRRVLPWTVAEVPATAPPERPVTSTTPLERESVLDVAVRRMRGHAPVAHRVWLPPLDEPETLGMLMPDLAPDPELGLVSPHWRALGGLTVPLGTVDRPREQRREVLTVDLSGAAGHVAVVGGPRSGKTTVLRTLVAALALTTTPLESQFYVLDLGGGAFGALRALPHLAGLGSRAEPDVVRRIVAEVEGILDGRESYFRAEGIESVEAFRLRRAHGTAGDGYGEVFLVVDGWATLRTEFDDLELDVQRVAARGLAYGIHVLTTASRWADYRAAARDLFGTRLELRLGDPLDSEIDRRLAALVPMGRPGRGLVPDRLHVLTAVPRIDGDSDAATLGDGVAHLVRGVARSWCGPAGPKLRLLPELLPAADLLAGADAATTSGRQLLVGVDEKQLAPVGLDPDLEPHWLVFGDGRSGKTTALRDYMHEMMRSRTPQQAQLVVVDYRRSLLGEVPADYLLHYLTSASGAAPVLAELASYLETRLPGPEVTPEQLRGRSWWTGAEVFVVVDDYDLVATAHSSPVQPLVPLLAQARDLGLHLALARRSGGASRALYEPVIQTLCDLGAPGLVLSGSPDEGPLIGRVRPVPAPPGRGRLVTRARGTEVVQLAWRAPAA
jgi:DNA segregation ATPase FtsK/SpoIIIE, S-DNA-T family